MAAAESPPVGTAGPRGILDPGISPFMLSSGNASMILPKSQNVGGAALPDSEWLKCVELSRVWTDSVWSDKNSRPRF